MRVAPVAALTAASSVSALAARPPSTINAPSEPGNATTLQPAPWNSHAPPRSVVEMRAAACRAWADDAGISALPNMAAPSCRKQRRDQRSERLERSERSERLRPTSRRRVLVNRLVDTRLAERPDVRPHALWRTEDRPHRAARHHPRRAEVAQELRLFLEDRRLQCHERHEAAGLRVIERGQAILIHGIH